MSKRTMTPTQKEQHRIRCAKNYQLNKESIKQKQNNIPAEEKLLKKQAKKEYDQRYIDANRDHKNELSMIRYHNNKDEIKLKTAQYRADNADVIKVQKAEYKQTPRGKFRAYANNAKQKSIEFGLTFEEFSAFWQQPCEYCGSDIPTVGIDRIDSSKGYWMSNIKSCCTMCNYMKLAHTIDDFTHHISKIYNHLKLEEC